MGLDLVEYVLAVEDAFEVTIPVEDAAQLDSPRRLIDYLTARLVHANDGPPLLQTVFYRLRSALADELQIERTQIRPDTKIEDIAGTRTSNDVWSTVALRLGLRSKDLTHAPRAHWLAKLQRAPARSLGDVARTLAMMRPAALKPKTSGWTRSQITDAVVQLLEHQVGIELSRDDLDSKFVRDLGMG